MKKSIKQQLEPRPYDSLLEDELELVKRAKSEWLDKHSGDIEGAEHCAFGALVVYDMLLTPQTDMSEYDDVPEEDDEPDEDIPPEVSVQVAISAGNRYAEIFQKKGCIPAQADLLGVDEDAIFWKDIPEDEDEIDETDDDIEDPDETIEEKAFRKQELADNMDPSWMFDSEEEQE